MFEDLDDLLNELKASCESNIEKSHEKPFEEHVNICTVSNFYSEPPFSKKSTRVLQCSNSDGAQTAGKSSHTKNYELCISSSKPTQSACLTDLKSKSCNHFGNTHKIKQNSGYIKDNKAELLLLSKDTDIVSPCKGKLSESFGHSDFKINNACEQATNLKKSQVEKYGVSHKCFELLKYEKNIYKEQTKNLNHNTEILSVSDSEKNMRLSRPRRHYEITSINAVDSFMVQLYIESKEHCFVPFPFEIYPRMTLRLLKLKIENELAICKSSQKWIIGNSLVVDDEIRLCDCNLSPNSALILYIDSKIDFSYIKVKITNYVLSLKFNKGSRTTDMRKNEESISTSVADFLSLKLSDKRAYCFPNTDIDPFNIHSPPWSYLHKYEKTELEADSIPMNIRCKLGPENASIKVPDPSLEAFHNLKFIKHSTNSEQKVKSYNMSILRNFGNNLSSNDLRRHSSPDQRGKTSSSISDFLFHCQQSLSNKNDKFPPVSLEGVSSLLNQNANKYENMPRKCENSFHRETPPRAFLINKLKMLQKSESVNEENDTAECIKSETHSENSILKKLHHKLNDKKTDDLDIPVAEPDHVLTHEDPSEYRLTFTDEHLSVPETCHDDVKNSSADLNNMCDAADVCATEDSEGSDTKDNNSSKNEMALESSSSLNISDSKPEIIGDLIHSNDKIRSKSNDQYWEKSNEDGESNHEDNNCAENMDEHDSPVSQFQEDQVEVRIENSVETSEELSELTENYEFLLKVENLDIVENISNFNCPICLGDFESGEGVVLHECLHIFCRECLINAVEFSQDALIKCPYRDRYYSCENHLQQREIKALLTLDAYEKYLRRSIKAAESLADNSFHCLTPDCPGWCMFEMSINIFHCPVCHHYNCLNCCAIHEGLNCRQYQEKLKKLQKVDYDSEKTFEFLNKMIEDGKAVKCPKCDLILMKKWGCDWLKCSICTTEICWVTRGPRWGPGGRGDISGGCKCGVNGVKCHRSCTYCH